MNQIKSILNNTWMKGLNLKMQREEVSSMSSTLSSSWVTYFQEMISTSYCPFCLIWADFNSSFHVASNFLLHNIFFLLFTVRLVSFLRFLLFFMAFLSRISPGSLFGELKNNLIYVNQNHKWQNYCGFAKSMLKQVLVHSF